MGGDERRNIKVSPETFSALNEKKPKNDTWDEFLSGLLAGAPVEADTVELDDGQVNEIVRRLGDEVEGRLTNNHV